MKRFLLKKAKGSRKRELTVFHGCCFVVAFASYFMFYTFQGESGRDGLPGRQGKDGKMVRAFFFPAGHFKLQCITPIKSTICYKSPLESD